MKDKPEECKHKMSIELNYSQAHKRFSTSILNILKLNYSPGILKITVRDV